MDAEAGVKPRSPKGRAAARGLDARIRFQHPFMPAGDTSHPNQINPVKNSLDSEHGIYRDHGLSQSIDNFIGTAEERCREGET